MKTDATRKKTASRRRTCRRTGRTPPSQRSGPTYTARAPNRLPFYRPRRDGLITQVMSDPNFTNPGYRSQEAYFVNARTSGVFWCSSKTRDQRQFLWTKKKTMQRQGIGSVFSSYIIYARSLDRTNTANNVSFSFSVRVQIFFLQIIYSQKNEFNRFQK